MTLTTAIGLALVGVGLQSSVTAQAAEFDAVTTSMNATNGVEKYIITFTEAGLLEYRGGVQGLASTAPNKAAGQRKLDVHSASARSYEAYLASQRNIHVAAIESALSSMLGRNRTLDVTHSYSVTLNGIAADLSADEAAKIATLPGIESVRPAGVQYLDTYRGPTFIGANTIWNGSNVPGGVGNKGQGIVVGVLDGGTNSTHPSFANDPACGFSTTTPKLIAKDCSASTGGLCTGTNPEANPTYGHGVHTSSTVAGNTIDNTASPSPLLPNGVTSMSGVAPCASIRQYKVCQTNTCGSADILAGIQNAITDQVDVINFSISGGNSPWSDNDRQFLNAVNADVFVTASAGNTSATITNPVGQVAHLGPWVMTVAASTQDESLTPQLTVAGPGTPPAGLSGIKLTPGSTSPWGAAPLTGYPILAYPTNIEGCTATGAFPPGYFQDKIALVRRGTCNFSEKITNAYNAGARIVVVGNNQAGTISMDTSAVEVPATSFSIGDVTVADALIAFVNAHPPGSVDPDVIFKDGFDGTAPAAGTTVNFNPAVHGTRQADVLGDFSLRGPTAAFLANLTKPDITAPGVDIFAALDQANGNYGLMSGTSMSGPHVAGSAVLMRAAHPDWTVTEVKSAMMMTATRNNGTKENGTTPWDVDDVGSGRVDLTKAARAGLTMDETYANYLAANPSSGGDVKTLNIPALRNMNCVTSCTWTRTVKNRLATSGTWNITSTTDAAYAVTAAPATFTLAPGATQVITFTATPNTTMSAIKFGYINLHETSNRAPDQHITVALKGDGSAPPTPGDGVTCSGGTCTFKIDELDSNFSGIGCSSYCGLVWLNRFTPPSNAYPITIKTIQTIFGAGAGWNNAGDPIDFYVYVDSDNDPSNGATLVGSYRGYTMGAPVNSWTTITLPTPITVNGPGDILIALTSPPRSSGAQGLRPASTDVGGVLNGERSWIGDYVGPNPDLGSAGVALEQNSAAGFKNFLIRASGTGAGGRSISLDNTQ